MTAAAVVAVLGLAGAGIWWHEAVTTDAFEFDGAADNVFRGVGAGNKTGVVDVDNALGSESTVEHLPGGEFSAFMDLRNHGRHDVRIVAFPRTGYGYWGLDHVVVAADDGDHFPEGDRPFRPFTLPAGESRRLRADFRFADCGPDAYFDRGYSTIRSLPVKYRILGWVRTVSVEFSEAAITSQTLVGDCAHPIEDPDGGIS